MSTNEERIAQLEERFEEDKKLRRAELLQKQYSPAVAQTPLAQLLIQMGAGLDYSNALEAFIEDQWNIYRAATEELSASSESANSTIDPAAA